jgi:ethanolamine transporter EutH
VLFSGARVVPVAVVCLMAFGLAYFLVNALVTSTVTMASTDEYRGRVMGLLGMANVGLIPVNAVVAGLLASVIGPVWTVGGAATGLLVFSIWFIASGRFDAVDDVVVSGAPLPAVARGADVPGVPAAVPALVELEDGL